MCVHCVAMYHRTIDSIKRETDYIHIHQLWKSKELLRALPPNQLCGMILGRSEMLIFCANEQNRVRYMPLFTLINVNSQ